MTALIEMEAGVAEDPRHLEAFKALREELGKLGHPACPDVDWDRVEVLCTRLFQSNGADLYSMVACVLARSHRHGLHGMVQGLELIESLLSHWPRLWPAADAAKAGMLDWMFLQLPPLLRGWSENSVSASLWLQLQARLERMQQVLAHLQVPSRSLQALLKLLEGLQLRTQDAQPLPNADAPRIRHTTPQRLMPLVIMPPPEAPPLLPAEPPPPGRRRFALIGAGLVLLVGLLVWSVWSHGRAERAVALPAPGPVNLSSPVLFDVGSARIRPDALAGLVKAFVEIEARPGWLIVIAGHADSTGEAQQNRQLSQARAIAVRDWIQRIGKLPDSCFVVQGVADSQPVASNAQVSGRTANRRVDIRLLPQPHACDQDASG